MKKIAFFLLLALASTGPLLAQNIQIEFPSSPVSRADQTFNSPRVGSGNKLFFFRMPNGNSMLLELSSLRQIDSLPRIDSLVAVCLEHLRSIGDTGLTSLVSKRVDAVFGTGDDVRMRVLNHPQPTPVYRIKGGEVTQLKLEQDTLRLHLFTRRASSQGLPIFGEVMHLTFLANHLADLPALLKQTPLTAALAQLQKDLAPLKTQRSGNISFSRYNAIYDVATGRRILPRRGELRGYGKRNSVAPYVQLGVQYLRGAWMPSAGVGIEWVRKTGNLFENRFQLLWEPYFVFGDDPMKATRVHRNDFVTLKVRQSSAFKTRGKEFDFVQNFSVGYLVHRSGTRFEPTTFKFSVPGFQAKNVLLEPEFVFNRWFKGFSPSLKLTLFIE